MQAAAKTEEPREFLTCQEAEKVLRVSRTTLHRWRKQGRIRSVKIGGRVLIPRQQLDDLIAA